MKTPNQHNQPEKCCELCEGNHRHFTGVARVDCPCHKDTEGLAKEIVELNPHLWDTPEQESWEIKNFEQLNGASATRQLKILLAQEQERAKFREMVEGMKIREGLEENELIGRE